MNPAVIESKAAIVRAGGCARYAKARVVRANDSSIQETWHSEVLLRMRKGFKRGRLPLECREQLCLVVVGTGKPHGEERPSAVVKVWRLELA